VTLRELVIVGLAVCCWSRDTSLRLAKTVLTSTLLCIPLSSMPGPKNGGRNCWSAGRGAKRRAEGC